MRIVLPLASALLALLALAGPLALRRDEALAAKPKEKDVLAQADAFIASKKVETKQDGWRLRVPQPPVFTFATSGKQPVWVLETSKGRLVFRLRSDLAPGHVSNLIYLTRLGFYDGLSFHRVIKGFMAQGGCPRGTGSSALPYGLKLEVGPATRYDRRGLLAAARTSDPNSAGSQFFITFGPTPGLNPSSGPGGEGYTLYGEAIEGQDTTLKALEAAGAASDPGRPSEALTITKATVELR